MNCSWPFTVTSAGHWPLRPPSHLAAPCGSSTLRSFARLSSSSSQMDVKQSWLCEKQVGLLLIPASSQGGLQHQRSPPPRPPPATCCFSFERRHGSCNDLMVLRWNCLTGFLLTTAALITYWWSDCVIPLTLSPVSPLCGLVIVIASPYPITLSESEWVFFFYFRESQPFVIITMVLKQKSISLMNWSPRRGTR